MYCIVVSKWEKVDGEADLKQKKYDTSSQVSGSIAIDGASNEG